MIMSTKQGWTPPDGTVTHGEPLSRHTTWTIGGPADFFVKAVSERDVQATLDFVRRENLPLFTLGAGSNVLFSDAGFRGVVLTLKDDLAAFEFQGTRLTAGAGASLPRVSSQAARRGLSGLEFGIGIPGQIGGSLINNSGTRDDWMSLHVERIRLCTPDGEIQEWTKEEANFRYRGSDLVGNVVLRAEFPLVEAPSGQVTEKSQSYRRARSESQPIGTRNAGCVFKNPEGTSAGRLIDELGLKDMRVGDAVVSPIHANFVVNLGNASAGEVLTLLKQIRQRALDERGIALEPEIFIVGPHSPERIGLDEA